MSADPALTAALSHAERYLDRLSSRPVCPRATVEQLRQRLARPLSSAGLPAEQVIDDLVADVEDGLVGSVGGRFFGWVIGGALPAAVAADWLTSVWDQNAVLNACGPAAAVVEDVAGEWIKMLLGLPADA